MISYDNCTGCVRLEMDNTYLPCSLKKLECPDNIPWDTMSTTSLAVALTVMFVLFSGNH